MHEPQDTVTASHQFLILYVWDVCLNCKPGNPQVPPFLSQYVCKNCLIVYGLLAKCLGIGQVLAKKRTRPISSKLDQTSLVNRGLMIWLKGLFLSGQDSCNHSAGFFLSAHGASHIINAITTCSCCNLFGWSLWTTITFVTPLCNPV